MVFVNGLPQTTKEDSTNHGYGTKSMKIIVQKYKGEIKFAIKGNVFLVSIILPNESV